MGSMSRNKGAAFERQIAKELFLLTGIAFKRNLDQYQSKGLDDLRADDPAWPFAMELKRVAEGVTCRTGWKAQAQIAAVAAGKMPAVVFRFDRQETRVAVQWVALAKAYGPPVGPDEWVEMTLEGLAFLAREIMADGLNV